MLKKLIAILISVVFVIEQTGFAQVAPQLVVPQYLQGLVSADKFRPMQLRSVGLGVDQGALRVILEKGDENRAGQAETEQAAQRLLNYFKVGLALPNSAFWVNLRPDAADAMIDPQLEKTDAGKVLLEADLQLKKDLAALTSPATPEGRQYWDKLYQRAEALFPGQEAQLPTYNRPWIVPGEIILGVGQDNSAYIFKAGLKVLLESDALAESTAAGQQQLTAVPSFEDQRLKELNDYSAHLVKTLILPQLTRRVNSGRQYAQLRQVFYALVLAQWFKQRFPGFKSDLSGLASAQPWSRETYFRAYQDSLRKGEYDRQEAVNSQNGLTVRRYFSGGVHIPELFLSAQNGPAASEVTMVSLTRPVKGGIEAVAAPGVPLVVRSLSAENNDGGNADPTEDLSKETLRARLQMINDVTRISAAVAIASAIGLIAGQTYLVPPFIASAFVFMLAIPAGADYSRRLSRLEKLEDSPEYQSGKDGGEKKIIEKLAPGPKRLLFDWIFESSTIEARVRAVMPDQAAQEKTLSELSKKITVGDPKVDFSLKLVDEDTGKVMISAIETRIIEEADQAVQLALLNISRDPQVKYAVRERAELLLTLIEQHRPDAGLITAEAKRLISDISRIFNQGVTAPNDIVAVLRSQDALKRLDDKIVSDAGTYALSFYAARGVESLTRQRVRYARYGVIAGGFAGFLASQAVHDTVLGLVFVCAQLAAWLPWERMFTAVKGASPEETASAAVLQQLKKEMNTSRDGGDQDHDPLLDYWLPGFNLKQLRYRTELVLMGAGFLASTAVAGFLLPPVQIEALPPFPLDLRTFVWLAGLMVSYRKAWPAAHHIAGNFLAPLIYGRTADYQAAQYQLYKVFHSTMFSARLFALNLLGNRGQTEQVRVVLAGHPDARLRKQAAFLLAIEGEDEIDARALRNAMEHDASADVREQAERSLEALERFFAENNKDGGDAQSYLDDMEKRLDDIEIRELIIDELSKSAAESDWLRREVHVNIKRVDYDMFRDDARALGTLMPETGSQVLLLDLTAEKLFAQEDAVEKLRQRDRVGAVDHAITQMLADRDLYHAALVSEMSDLKNIVETAANRDAGKTNREQAVAVSDIRQMLGLNFVFFAFIKEMEGDVFGAGGIRDELEAALEALPEGTERIRSVDVSALSGLSAAQRRYLAAAVAFLNSLEGGQEHAKALNDRVFIDVIRNASAGTLLLAGAGLGFSALLPWVVTMQGWEAGSLVVGLSTIGLFGGVSYIYDALKEVRKSRRDGGSEELESLIETMISLSADKKERVAAIRKIGDLGDRDASAALILTMFANILDGRIRSACWDSLAKIGAANRDGGRKDLQMTLEDFKNVAPSARYLNEVVAAQGPLYHLARISLKTAASEPVSIERQAYFARQARSNAKAYSRMLGLSHGDLVYLQDGRYGIVDYFSPDEQRLIFNVLGEEYSGQGVKILISDPLMIKNARFLTQSALIFAAQEYCMAKVRLMLKNIERLEARGEEVGKSAAAYRSIRFYTQKFNQFRSFSRSRDGGDGNISKALFETLSSDVVFMLAFHDVEIVNDLGRIEPADFERELRQREGSQVVFSAYPCVSDPLRYEDAIAMAYSGKYLIQVYRVDSIIETDKLYVLYPTDKEYERLAAEHKDGGTQFAPETFAGEVLRLLQRSALSMDAGASMELVNMGDLAVEPLVTVIEERGQQGVVIEKAIQALGLAARETADAGLRDRAIRTLAAVIEKKTGVFDHPFRLAAVNALVYIGDEAAVPALRLAAKDAIIGAVAREGLRQFSATDKDGGTGAAPELVGRLDSLKRQLLSLEQDLAVIPHSDHESLARKIEISRLTTGVYQNYGEILTVIEQIERQGSFRTADVRAEVGSVKSMAAALVVDMLLMSKARLELEMQKQDKPVTAHRRIDEELMPVRTALAMYRSALFDCLDAVKKAAAGEPLAAGTTVSEAFPSVAAMVKEDIEKIEQNIVKMKDDKVLLAPWKQGMYEKMIQRQEALLEKKKSMLGKDGGFARALAEKRSVLRVAAERNRVYSLLNTKQSVETYGTALHNAADLEMLVPGDLVSFAGDPAAYYYAGHRGNALELETYPYRERVPYVINNDVFSTVLVIPMGEEVDAVLRGRMYDRDGGRVELEAVLDWLETCNDQRLYASRVELGIPAYYTFQEVIRIKESIIGKLRDMRIRGVRWVEPGLARDRFSEEEAPAVIALFSPRDGGEDDIDEVFRLYFILDRTDNPAQRSEAVIALADIDHPLATRALIKSLKNDQLWQIRGDAALALRQVTAEKEKAMEALLGAMHDDPAWSVRKAAATALGSMRAYRFADELSFSMMKDRNWGVRQEALRSLVRLQGGETADLLMRSIVYDPAWSVRKSAARALGHINSQDALPLLKYVVQNEYKREVRLEAKESIKKLQENRDGGAGNLLQTFAGLQAALEQGRHKAVVGGHDDHAADLRTVAQMLEQADMPQDTDLQRWIKLAADFATGDMHERCVVTSVDMLVSLAALVHARETDAQNEQQLIRQILDTFTSIVGSGRTEAVRRAALKAHDQVRSLQKDGGIADAPGGVDFRALPLNAVPVAAAAMPLTAVSSVPLAALDKEWAALVTQMRNGPMPYDQLKAHVQRCRGRQEADAHLQEVAACVKKILEMEEDAAVATAPQLKEVLCCLS